MNGGVDYGAIFIWSLVLVAFLIGMFLLVHQIKNWVKSPEASIGTGFTLSDLRQLHKSGQMSDEEFDKAKSRIIEAAQKASARPATTRGGVESKLDQ
jgi:uncharacterized membrane protein